MFSRIVNWRVWLIAGAAASLLAAPASGIEFEFIYDDQPGQGFLHPTQGAARQAALAEAGNIWGRLIPATYPGETVEVVVKFIAYPAGSITLASAAPNFHYSDFGSSNPAYLEDVNYPKALGNHLALRDLAPVRQEINMFVNQATSYYFGIDGTPSGSQTDFISVAVHELGHGLGYDMSFQQDGDFGTLGNRTSTDPCPGCLPVPYDVFLTSGPGGPTLTSLSTSQRAAALVSNNVFWNGAAATAANGGTPVKINAPSPWNPGSSIAHLDPIPPLGLPNAVMGPNIGAGVLNRTPTGVDRALLRDMGWTITAVSTQVNWTGLGADNNATTAANWSPVLPQPDDSLVFDQSPRTDVQMNLQLGTLQGISFPATAPAYTLRFKSNFDAEITGSGIINSSPNAQKIFLESAHRDDPTPSLTHSAAALTFKNTANAGNSDYHLRGGGTSIAGIAPPHGTYYFDRYPGASVTFDNNSTAGTASFEVEGGAGADGPNAQVTFRHDSSASGGEFRTKGGRLGPDLPLGNVIVGLGGHVLFEDRAKAGVATFHNEGQAESFGGAGGWTEFTGTSTAEGSEIHNHGATTVNGLGGATIFYNTSTAGAARITNHADGTNFGSVSARTIFHDSANAGTATIENQGTPSQAADPGLTEFRNLSSAANATINNRGHVTVGDAAGRTVFYDDSTAANATLRTFNGLSDYGRIEFRNRSTAADATIALDTEPAVVGSRGGYLQFYDDSTAARSDITLSASTAGFSGLQFFNKATAGDARVVVDDAGGNVFFWGTSSAGDPVWADTPLVTANFTLAASNVMSFQDQSTADDATITLANRAQLFFQNNSSAGQAQISAAGGSVYTAGAQAVVTFNSNSTADRATILATGAAAPLASPGAVVFMNGAHAAQATIIANSGSNGGDGATITFSNANGDAARVIAHAGSTVDFLVQPSFNNGSTTLGSIQGAGRYVLRGSHLIAGSLGDSTTISGPITDNPTANPFYSGGRLTKVGTGALTLAGVNTYSGLTTVSAGTLRLTGSIAGDVDVSAGARFEQGGPIAGELNVAPGGVWAPGSSPGTATLGGLNMSAGSLLDFEIGPTRDHIVLTNNGAVSLDGILNISFIDGFIPTLGQTFPLFEGSIGSITGAFDAVLTPVINGLTLNLVQTASSVALQAGPPINLPGDFNRDGSVNTADFTHWKTGFGAAAGATHAQGDADNDADVDGFDFLVWQRQFGIGPTAIPADAAVPEPAGSVLFALAISLIISCRRCSSRPC